MITIMIIIIIAIPTAPAVHASSLEKQFPEPYSTRPLAGENKTYRRTACTRIEARGL